MKKTLIIAVLALLTGAAYLGLSELGTGVPDAEATKPSVSKYMGTIYVAGMGGHFAVADEDIGNEITILLDFQLSGTIPVTAAVEKHKIQ